MSLGPIPSGPGRPARLVSVNVGRPRTIEWRGKPVRTSIWKEPVHGRRPVTHLNVDGDAQADLVGHGGEHRAVFVYQLGSYEYWASELGRAITEPGQFGENFTVDGLPDDEVCIGDRFAIGSAVFEVSQPRVTCYKVGIRLDEPRMPALLTGHGRPGFYLRVIQEGVVGAGDAIVPVSAGPGGLTIQGASALLYTPDLDVAALRTAIGIPALPEGWKESFRRLLDQAERGADGNRGLSPLADRATAYTGFRPFRIEEARAESASVRSLRFAPADGGPLPAHLPGQFVTVKLAAPDGTVIIRSYSLSAAADGQHLRISVKRDGRASTIVHDGVAVGDEVELGAPRGSFVLDPAGHDPVALVSAGIGVTPVLAMLGALARSGHEGPVTWIHVARSGAEHAFLDEARELLAQLPGATSHVRYTQPGPAEHAGTGFDAVGRLTASDLRSLGVGPETDAYVCGPDRFMADVSAILAAEGLDPARIHTEAFGAAAPGKASTPPHAPEPPAANGYDVFFARSGLSVRFDPDRWTSLLELAEACDVPADWSCRTGVCHRCETAVVAGAVAYDPEPLDVPADGAVLLCCSQPREAITLDA